MKNIKWEAVIGLEIHAELKTKSKMFCACKNDPFNSKPNENVCPVCLAMPGALPVLNKKAIDWTILTGLALNCKINKFSKWDRKNYFYPDLPKGYQISQYDLPLVYDGKLKIDNREIGITRIHLEEDTGTSKHPEGRVDVDYSLLDFNRAGVPLMELVTEPDVRNAQQAKEFCKRYQQILRTLKIADANMEKGQMRCEANISVRKTGDKKFGTKVEVKNLNSFKSVERAIEYEIDRQIEANEAGEEIMQQTRGWDEKGQKTYIMRVKETSADYRYFPEPDLPPVKISDKGIDQLKKQLPEMPEEKSKKLIERYGISKKNASLIVSDMRKIEYFDYIIQKANIKYQNDKSKSKKIIISAVNWIINEIPQLDVKVEYLIELLEMIYDSKISIKTAKDILPEIKKGKSPKQIVKEKGLEQISDTGSLEKTVDDVIKNNSDAVVKIKAGQMGVMGFLVGQVMQQTKGQANPKIVNELLRKKIV